MEGLEGISRKCFARLFEELLPHNEPNDDCVSCREAKSDHSERRSSAMRETYLVYEEKEAEPRDDESSVDYFDFHLRF